MSIMTESEAKEKQCPLMGSGLLCLTSDCMAWRWCRGKETKAYLGAVQQRMLDTGEAFNKATQKVYAERGSTFEETEDFCGLAGKP